MFKGDVGACYQHIRNANICHLSVRATLSMPCSAITAAVCRPSPRETEYDTNAAAMMLRAFRGQHQSCLYFACSLRRVLVLLTSEKKMKKSSQPSCFTTCAREKSFRETVEIAMPVKTHAMTLISVPRLSFKSASVVIVAIVEE